MSINEQMDHIGISNRLDLAKPAAWGFAASLMNGEPGTGQEMELFAVQTAAVEAEALSTVDPARATIN